MSVNVIIVVLHDPEVLFTVKDAPNGNTGLNSPINMFKKTHNSCIHNSKKQEIVQMFINSRMDQKEIL